MSSPGHHSKAALSARAAAAAVPASPAAAGGAGEAATGAAAPRDVDEAKGGDTPATASEDVREERLDGCATAEALLLQPQPMARARAALYTSN